MVAATGRAYTTGQDVRHRTFWGRAAPGRHGARPLARCSAHGVFQPYRKGLPPEGTALNGRENKGGGGVRDDGEK